MSGAITAGVLGVGLSLYQGSRAQKQAEELADQQARAMGFASEQARRQYEEEAALWRPVKQRLINEYSAETPSDYGKYVDLVHQRYGEALRSGAAQNIGTSGLQASTLKGAQLAQAGDLARAYTEAKERQRTALAGLMGQDRSASLGQAYVGQLGQQAGMYGQHAAVAGGLAGQAYGAAAAGIGGIAQELGRRFYTPAPAPSVEISPSASGVPVTPAEPLPTSYASGDYGFMPPALGSPAPVQKPAYMGGSEVVIGEQPPIISSSSYGQGAMQAAFTPQPYRLNPDAAAPSASPYTSPKSSLKWEY